MLDCGWDTASQIMITGAGEESTGGHHDLSGDHHIRHVYDPYATIHGFPFPDPAPAAIVRGDAVATGESLGIGSINNLPTHHQYSPFSFSHDFQQHYHQQQQQQQQPHFHSVLGFPGASTLLPPPPSMLSLDMMMTSTGAEAAETVRVAGDGPSGFMMLPPKIEPVSPSPRMMEYYTSSRIGLNLGGRTYFSAGDDNFIGRLYRRSRPWEAGGFLNIPRCQAEGCNADLSHAKHYHRRHKVCEFHAKASTVVANGLTQRFCQQCSRFHVLTEFDNGKRSCRRRLADHNRRRRKSHQLMSNLDSRPENPQDLPSENVSRSPSDSGAHSSSSVSVSVSPPRISLDSFSWKRPYDNVASANCSS